MNRDHSFHNTGSTQILLAHDRRSDARRSCRAIAWLLDEDFVRAEEFGAVIDISRGGVSMCPCSDCQTSVEACKPGREWLVLLDDPTGLEPLADQRVAIIRLLRVETEPTGSTRMAFEFASRQSRRCLPARSRRSRPEPVSDVVSGDLLDELAERVQRDIAAAIRADTL